MQTNKPKYARPFLLLPSALALLLTVFLMPVLTGADNQNPEQVQAPPEAVKQAPVDEKSDAAKKQQDAGEAGTDTVKEFKPSEQIGADSAVAFPIDI
ncbi:MAG: hypothetical protein KJN61_09310 [Gammaproteobacteria bacterium]|nr:hypothetical protein [Gammaproteobacteria bacterium]NNK99673.1 hypothetical protein [Xanthomonadales bacterium]